MPLNQKTKVIHFQRKPRHGFNFSVEGIFQNLRNNLQHKTGFFVCISPCYNDGYFSKLINIVAAAFQQKKNTINHITGEVNFLDLFMHGQKTLLTIHDCRYVNRKKGLQQQLVKWLYLKAPVKRSALITAVSESTKADIIRYTNCKPGKIKVIPNQVNDIFKPSPKTFNKEKPVILQIGAAENKNILRLIDALKNISCTLVIVGDVNNEQLDHLKTSNINYVLKTGLSDDELYNEYVKCDIVSFISTHEGFGMPIVEANCTERAVITSNISSMPEVAGDAACLVNPCNIEEIKQGFLKVIQDDNYREQVICNGRKNKERFNSITIAEEYYSIYQKIASSINE